MKASRFTNVSEAFGRVVRVSATDEELPRNTLVIEFERGWVSLSVDESDDTVVIDGPYSRSEGDTVSANLTPAESGSDVWSSIIGKRLTTSWVLENDKGYCDGIQFRFFDEGSEPIEVQLVAAASEFRLGKVERISEPWWRT